MILHPRAKDITGQRFGRLMVVEPTTERRRRSIIWRCRCDCGTEKLAQSSSLLNEGTASCGCIKREQTSKQGYENRIYPVGFDSHSRLYTIWKNMHDRCTNPAHIAYERYKGLTIYGGWDTYGPFVEWALANGYTNELTIDRRDNWRGYHPDNCRWVTMKVQNRNRKNNQYLTAFGERKLLVEWAEDPRSHASAKCIARRVKNGRSPEQAIAMTEGDVRRLASKLREAKRWGRDVRLSL